MGNWNKGSAQSQPPSMVGAVVGVPDVGANVGVGADVGASVRVQHTA